jgi:CubicO group peptidase (beta-lactamase class C family)
MTPEEWSYVVDKPKPDETIGGFSKKYASVPLKFNPGENWEYSRSTDVLSYLVEIITGMSFNEYLKKHIYKPLKMKDTYHYLPVDKVDRLATCYTPSENGGIRVSDPGSTESVYVKKPHTYFRGASGMVSTAMDYYRFSQMLLNGGELDDVRILSRKTVELMTRNHTGDLYNHILGPGYGFGLGFGIQRDPSTINTLIRKQATLALPWSIGSYHWGGAFCTIAWVDPVEDLIGVFMTQLNPNDHVTLRSDIVRSVYQAIID